MPTCLRRVFLLLSLIALPVFAAEPLSGLQQRLRPEFADLAGTRKLPGLSVALVVDGRPLWVESFGLADRTTRRALSNDTRHALGDLSKPFLAALALRLAADGRVALDVPVTRYLPALSLAGGETDAVTLQRLLTHHAGLPANQLAGMYRDAAEPAIAAPPAEALYFAQPPATTYAYSNIGVELAARVLESAGGASVDSLLQREVITPLQLQATSYEARDDDARGHRKGKPLLAPAARERAALGLRASVADLARFVAALTAADPPLPLQALLQPAGENTPLDIDYRNSLAFSLFADARSEVGTVVRLTSLYPGSRARIDIAPRQRAAVVVLANSADASDEVDELADRLLDGWLEAAHGIAPRERRPRLPDTAPWPTEARPDEAARYYSSAAGLIELSPVEGGFDARLAGLRLSAERRSDGWYRLHLRVLGLPLDLGPLRRILVAPALVDDQRVLMLWTVRRRFFVGTAWSPPALPPEHAALAGAYRLLNPDRITVELGISELRLDLADGVLSASYPLDIPMLRTRVPLQSDGADGLRVPGIGSLVGERLRIERSEGHLRLHYSGYVFERE